MTALLRLIALIIVALPAAALADPVFPPGSRIGIVPPPGMTASTTFQGFEDRARGAILVLTELSAQSYVRVERDFSSERMRASGMEEIARETVDLAGGPALMVGARQSENGVMMRKWALLTLSGGITAVAIMALPETAHDAYPDAALRAALTSLTIRARLAPEEMLAVLPYRLDNLGGFRLLRTSPDGTAVLTFGPNDTTLPAEQPYFMVAPRVAEPPQPEERDRFAQRALTSFTGRPNLNIVSSEPIRIGGTAGHEIIAESKDDRTGDELMTVQWLRFGTNGFLQMFGMARKDQWAAVLPRMRALRDGFQRK